MIAPMWCFAATLILATADAPPTGIPLRIEVEPTSEVPAPPGMAAPSFGDVLTLDPRAGLVIARDYAGLVALVGKSVSEKAGEVAIHVRPIVYEVPVAGPADGFRLQYDVGGGWTDAGSSSVVKNSTVYIAPYYLARRPAGNPLKIRFVSIAGAASNEVSLTGKVDALVIPKSGGPRIVAAANPKVFHRLALSLKQIKPSGNVIDEERFWSRPDYYPKRKVDRNPIKDQDIEVYLFLAGYAPLKCWLLWRSNGGHLRSEASLRDGVDASEIPPERYRPGSIQLQLNMSPGPRTLDEATARAAKARLRASFKTNLDIDPPGRPREVKSLLFKGGQVDGDRVVVPEWFLRAIEARIEPHPNLTVEQLAEDLREKNPSTALSDYWQRFLADSLESVEAKSEVVLDHPALFRFVGGGSSRPLERKLFRFGAPVGDTQAARFDVEPVPYAVTVTASDNAPLPEEGVVVLYENAAKPGDFVRLPEPNYGPGRSVRYGPGKVDYLPAGFVGERPAEVGGRLRIDAPDFLPSDFEIGRGAVTLTPNGLVAARPAEARPVESRLIVTDPGAWEARLTLDPIPLAKASTILPVPPKDFKTIPKGADLELRLAGYAPAVTAHDPERRQILAPDAFPRPTDPRRKLVVIVNDYAAINASTEAAQLNVRNAQDKLVTRLIEVLNPLGGATPRHDLRTYLRVAEGTGNWPEEGRHFRALEGGRAPLPAGNDERHSLPRDRLWPDLAGLVRHLRSAHECPIVILIEPAPRLPEPGPARDWLIRREETFKALRIATLAVTPRRSEVKDVEESFLHALPVLVKNGDEVEEAVERGVKALLDRVDMILQ